MRFTVLARCFQTSGFSWWLSDCNRGLAGVRPTKEHLILHWRRLNRFWGKAVVEVQTLNGRTLIFVLLSTVHQRGRFPCCIGAVLCFRNISRIYIYIFARWNSRRTAPPVVIIHPKLTPSRETIWKKDKEREREKGREGKNSESAGSCIFYPRPAHLFSIVSFSPFRPPLL